MTDEVELDLSRDKARLLPRMHRWWASRQPGEANALLHLTNDPNLTDTPEKLQTLADEPASSDAPVLDGLDVLDLCSGSGAVAKRAVQLGGNVTAVDNHPIAVLIGMAELEFPARFGTPDTNVRGIGDNGSWDGLGNEFEHWATKLLDHIKENTQHIRADGVYGLRRARLLRCDSCGTEGPATRDAADDAFTVTRAMASCPRCGHEAPARDIDTGRYVTRSVIPVEGRSELPPAEHRGWSDVTEYPERFRSKLSDVWVVGTRPLSFQEALTPRQATFIDAMRTSFRAVRGELADNGYSPASSTGVLTLLALLMSSVSLDLNTETRLDQRRGHLQSALARQEWARSYEFVELCDAGFEIRFARHVARMAEAVRNAGSPPHASAVPADMADLPFDDDSFDLVIWDPPYYDNIDYGRITLPITRLLRELVGDLFPHLKWPVDPGPDTGRTRLDVATYERNLSEAVTEIARVLRPGQRLGVFWITRDSDQNDLREFLENLAPRGFELVATVDLRTEHGLVAEREHPRRRHSVFLIFRSTASPLPTDARTLLGGTATGRKMVYAGAVELLTTALEPDELEELVPPGFKGTLHQRVHEHLLSIPDPRELIREVPKRSLREFIRNHDADGFQPGTSLDELVDRTFTLLGWQIPRAPAFTVGSRIESLAETTSRLRLATSGEEIRGIALTAAQLIEDIVRFTVVTWATLLRGDEWATLLEDVCGKPSKLTFGDWCRLLREIPDEFAGTSAVLGRAGRRLRTGKIRDSLDQIVPIRNRIAHPSPDTVWPQMRDEAVPVLALMAERLRKAEIEGAFPDVLKPLEETRDSFGRITLRLQGHNRRAEILLTAPSDLSKPLILMRGDTNPREVDPVSLPIDDVFTRAEIDDR